MVPQLSAHPGETAPRWWLHCREVTAERGQSEQQGPLGDMKGRGHTLQPLDMQEQGSISACERRQAAATIKFTQSK